MKPSQFLEKAKALIDTPEKWTKEAWARDAYGNPKNSGSAEVVCFCSHGAANRMEQSLPHYGFSLSPLNPATKAKGLLEEACLSLTGHNIIYFNDHHKTTHDQIMEVWNLAIQLAKEKEA